MGEREKGGRERESERQKSVRVKEMGRYDRGCIAEGSE